MIFVEVQTEAFEAQAFEAMSPVGFKYRIEEMSRKMQARYREIGDEMKTPFMLWMVWMQDGKRKKAKVGDYETLEKAIEAAQSGAQHEHRFGWARTSSDWETWYCGGCDTTQPGSGRPRNTGRRQN